MRLLEVGAGVGAVAQRCAPLLRQLGVNEYWFTDLGKLFVQRARDIYGGHDPMRFATLDLDRPFAEQGFLPGRFDAVIAVDVLHVAQNLRFTLREIYRALKPRSWLIFAEGSPAQPLPALASGSRLRVFARLVGRCDRSTLAASTRFPFALRVEKSC